MDSLEGDELLLPACVGLDMSRSRPRTPDNETTTDICVSDELWAELEPLLPKRENRHRFGGGRPRVPDRCCADAIFFVLRTGAQWAALNNTKLWQAGVEHVCELRNIDWEWLSMDGAMPNAPFGGGKPGPNPTDRGKSGVKRSVLTEGHSVPIGVAVDGANRHDMKMLRPTIASIVVERPQASAQPPRGMCLDKGYDFDEVRATLEEFGFTEHIRGRG